MGSGYYSGDWSKEPEGVKLRGAIAKLSELLDEMYESSNENDQADNALWDGAECGKLSAALILLRSLGGYKEGVK